MSLKVIIPSSFYLYSNFKQPGIFSMIYQKHYKPLELSLFLETLPAVFTPNFRLEHQRTKEVLFGDSNVTARKRVAWIAKGQENPLLFLKHLTYDRYSQLEQDLETLNPEYRWIRNYQRTLDDYMEYFEEALPGAAVEDIVPYLSAAKNILTLEEFFQYFKPFGVNRDYIISHLDIEEIPVIHDVFKSYLSDVPQYVLSGEQGQEVLIFFENDQYHVITTEFESISFKKEEMDALQEWIGTFFGNESIHVDHPEESLFKLKLKTTAEQIADCQENTFDFKTFRTFVREKHNVKARSHQELINNYFEYLKTKKETLEYPVFMNMSRSDQNEPITTTRNETLQKKLKQENQEEKADLFFQLNASEKYSHVDPSHDDFRQKSFSDLTTSFIPFVMPDYGEEAEKAPTFNELMQNVPQ